MRRVLLAGTHSGCGKTTAALALLSALKARGLSASAFKCGPDYIDPLFHRAALGIPAHNLDPYFCGRDTLRGILSTRGNGLAVIEGVMGYYDGVGPEGCFSTYDVACETDTPVILVMDTRGMYASAGAVLRGFTGYRPDTDIRGVLFNRTSAALYKGLKQLAQDAGLLPLGFLPNTPECAIGSRHLGLLTPGELSDIRYTLGRLGELAESCLDMDGILALAASAPAIRETLPVPSPVSRVRVAVARDAAFSFLYQENLELLEALGCELIYFSPLADEALPESVGGLYLPGGYPELHPEALSKNGPMRRSVREAVENGLPTIAECGGYLYLHAALDGAPMAGAIPAGAYRTGKLQRFGYAELTAEKDNLLCKAGGKIRAHEFHYYTSDDAPAGFRAQKPSGGEPWAAARATDTLYAGFPHLYFYANPVFAEQFVRKAAAYASK